jgi:Ca2+-binding EF-hand superfamily protein
MIEQGEVVKTASGQTSPKREMPQVAQFSDLTIRQWFKIMDADDDGSVTRHDCFLFFVSNPQFRDTLLCESSPPLKDGSPNRQHQAFQMKQVMKMFKDVFSNSGVIDLEEFTEFFRRTGRLAEYPNIDSPRAQRADALGDFHSRDKVVVSSAEGRQMVQLARLNLPDRHRKAVERKAATGSYNTPVPKLA